MSQRITTTLGIDIGDRESHFFALDHETGEVLGRGRVKTAPEAMAELLSALPRSRVVVETGPQSAWVSHVAEEGGHEVIVGQSRELRFIYAQKDKSDKTDAERLARVGRLDPKLLHPIRHRSPQVQAHRSLVRSREALVRTRTVLVNHVRGTVKLFGSRLPSCSTQAFGRKVRESIPDELREALWPVLDQIVELTTRIRGYDARIKELVSKEYAEAAYLMQVPGVGALTALGYVLTIEDPSRFEKSRSVAAYVGLVPKRDQSGEQDRQLGITKAGDRTVRRLLVGAAQYILGPFGPDTDLRRWGHALAARGGKRGKRRAVVAVARKLAVLLHRLWVTKERYEPLRA